MTDEIFSYIFTATLIIIIFGGVFKFIKKSISETVDEIIRPEKGYFNYNVINLVEFIQSNRVHYMNISCRNDNSLRYLKLKHLETDCTSFKSTYIIIPKNLDFLLKNEMPNDYSDGYIKNSEFEKVLLFLIKNCFVYSYTDYPKDKFVHFQFSLKSSIEQYNINEESTKKIHSQVLALLKLYSTIYWDGKYVHYSYRDSYIKLIKEKNWTPQTSSLPKSWFYERFSKEWDNIRYDQITEN